MKTKIYNIIVHGFALLALVLLIKMQQEPTIVQKAVNPDVITDNVECYTIGYIDGAQAVADAINSNQYNQGYLFARKTADSLMFVKINR